MTGSSPLRLGLLTVMCGAMLTACAVLPQKVQAPSADPVIETRVQRIVFCPPEVVAPTPEPIKMPANPVVEATADVLAWIGARFAREQFLARRIDEAREQCVR